VESGENDWRVTSRDGCFPHATKFMLHFIYPAQHNICINCRGDEDYLNHKMAAIRLTHITRCFRDIGAC
jgi:hypothetical protein